LAYRNVADQRAAARRHYEANKDTYKARAKAHTERERGKARTVLAEYLSDHPCVDCGESDPVVLEFDHRDVAAKSFMIADAVRNGTSVATIMAEVEKCDVRCANCHRRRTWRQRKDGLFASPVERPAASLPLFDIQ